MALKSSLTDTPSAIDKYLNTAYDNVVLVADSITSVNTVAVNITNIDDVADNMADIITVVAAIPTITNAETNAVAAAVAAALSEAATAADLVLTNADVVLTNADVVLTAADVVLTNADVLSTAADVISSTDQADTATAAAAAALVSETNAATSETNTETLYDAFGDLWLGSHVTDPVLDNDGDALQLGAVYFNSAERLFYHYTDIGWREIGIRTDMLSSTFEYTASGAQATFTGADDNANTLSYTPGFLFITLNGHILDSSDYTADDGTSIVLTEDAIDLDMLYVLSLGTFTISDVYTKPEMDITTDSLQSQIDAIDDVTGAGVFSITALNDNSFTSQSTASNQITVTDGGKTVSAISDNIISLTTGAVTKLIGAAWTEGDTQGGDLEGTGVVADTWYHLYAIRKADASVDIGFSTLLSPTIPGGYGDYRWIGAFKTDENAEVISYHQVQDEFYFDEIQADYLGNGDGSSGEVVTDLSVPPIPAYAATALMNAVIWSDALNNGGGDVHIRTYRTGATQVTPSNTNSQLSLESCFEYGDTDSAGFEVAIDNALGQVKHQVYCPTTAPLTSFSYNIKTVGWKVNRSQI